MKLSRRTFITRASMVAGISLLASYPVFIEGRLLQLNTYTIPVPGLPAAFEGLRIAHITDVHLGPLVSKAFVEKVVQLANGSHPDLTVCTGDYVHERNASRQIDTVWPILAQLKARYGVYSVLGNHDHWADVERSLYWLDQTGQNLHHKSVKISHNGADIWLGGAGDYYEDRLGIDAAFENVPNDQCKILLTHNPDAIDQYFRTKINLAIAGHTHGGQVRIPFIGAPVLPVHNKKYSSGYIKSSKTNIFISRGVGWAILPVRLNCPPEVAVLHLQSA